MIGGGRRPVRLLTLAVALSVALPMLAKAPARAQSPLALTLTGPGLGCDGDRSELRGEPDPIRAWDRGADGRDPARRGAGRDGDH